MFRQAKQEIFKDISFEHVPEPVEGHLLNKMQSSFYSLLISPKPQKTKKQRIVEKHVNISINPVEKRLLLGQKFCGKVVENESCKILAGKYIVATLDVPSERYSRQTQKSVRVVMQHLRNMYSKEPGPSGGWFEMAKATIDSVS